MVNITLRETLETDLPVFYGHQLDPEACELADFQPRDREMFMAHWAKIMKDQAVILRTVLCDEKVAGNVVSWEQDGRREVSYWFGREYWGKGTATRAQTEFLRQGKIRPLYAYVAKRNAASARVLQKCGFSVQREEDGEIVFKIAEQNPPQIR